MRRVWIAVGVVLVLIIVAVIALNLWIHSYLRSEAFRQLVSARTGQALKIDAQYAPLDWSGSSVYSASLTGPGQSGGPIESFDAQQVRANVDWRAILDGTWRVSRIDLVRLDVAVRSATERAATVGEPGPTPEPAPPRKGFLPDKFRLDLVSVQDANLTVAGVSEIRHTALRIRPEGSGWVFDGSGGRLSLAKWQPLDIADFRVRLQQRVVYLTDANLRLGASGALRASGEVGGASAPFDMQLEWKDVDSRDVLDASWKERLEGRLAGEAHVLGRDGRPPVTTGHFELTDGLLKGLPVQKQIAKFTQTPQFERVPLQKVSGDCTHDGTTLVVKNFVAESQGLLRVEGDCTIGVGEALDGVFQVGVTSQSLQWLPGSREKVFVTSRDGYLWTTVKIGGTLQSPSEDLSSRLAQAMGEQVIETGVQMLQDAPEKANDAVDKALEILSPLLP
jgi:hypothetical protein